MKTIELDAYVTEDGEVRLKLPSEMSGERLRFKVEVVTEEVPLEDVGWIEEELNEGLKFNPVPAKDIVTGGWY